jgi:hypothetical protein
MSMPEYPIPHAALPAIPMPRRMPVQEASSFASSEGLTSEQNKVIAMEDYPAGRGGMRMGPMAQGEQPTQPAGRPGSPIGTRPPAIRMPANP